jgi:hypothetical protein
MGINNCSAWEALHVTNDNDKLFEKVNQGSFFYDPNAKSFQLTGFRWRDAPALIIGLMMSFLLLTGMNLAWAGLQVALPAEAVWLLLGVSIGYLLGIWVGRRPAAVVECPQPQRLGQEDNPGAAFTDLSDSVKAMADDGRKLEAVKLHMEQKGLELQKAKDAVESYMGKRG